MPRVGGGWRLWSLGFQEMLWLNLNELVAGAALIAVAVLFGRLLYRTARRNPNSILVNAGLVADLLCVFEVSLIVLGPMLLLHALLDIF